MRKWYNRIRWSGYTAGLLGLGAMLMGPRLDPPAPVIQAVGALLLLFMFLCFLITYGMFIVSRLNKRGGARKE